MTDGEQLVEQPDGAVHVGDDVLGPGVHEDDGDDRALARGGDGRHVVRDHGLTGGDDVTIGLNPQYLLEALGAVRSEFTRITFTSTDNANKLSPILVTAQTSAEGAGGDNFKYLLQPNLLLR